MTLDRVEETSEQVLPDQTMFTSTPLSKQQTPRKEMPDNIQKTLEETPEEMIKLWFRASKVSFPICLID